EPGDAERDDCEREGGELQHRLDERREEPVDERGEDERARRSADRDAGEDPRRDGERGGVHGPGDEKSERERHGAILEGPPRRPTTGAAARGTSCSKEMSYCF